MTVESVSKSIIGTGDDGKDGANEAVVVDDADDENNGEGKSGTADTTDADTGCSIHLCCTDNRETRVNSDRTKIMVDTDDEDGDMCDAGRVFCASTQRHAITKDLTSEVRASHPAADIDNDDDDDGRVEVEDNDDTAATADNDDTAVCASCNTASNADSALISVWMTALSLCVMRG